MKILGLLLSVLALSAQANPFSGGETSISTGGFRSVQGQEQLIQMQNLVGDIYSPTDKVASNVLLGVSRLYPAPNNNENLSYGLSVFYFPFSTVKGVITQEQAFTNLSYKYQIQNFPLYAVIKAKMKPSSKDYTLTMDAGLGPNIITMKKYQEASLDGVTLVNDSFKNNTSVAFSALMGLGVRFPKLLSKKDVEFGYKYFLLGKGRLDTAKPQVQTSLNAGASYAHALSVSVII